jgi:hypothetical protein
MAAAALWCCVGRAGIVAGGGRPGWERRRLRSRLSLTTGAVAADGAGRCLDGRGAGEGQVAMIPVPRGVQVWLATGHTDMRKGFDGLAVPVQSGQVIARRLLPRKLIRKFS